MIFNQFVLWALRPTQLESAFPLLYAPFLSVNLSLGLYLTLYPINLPKTLFSAQDFEEKPLLPGANLGPHLIPGSTPSLGCPESFTCASSLHFHCQHLPALCPCSPDGLPQVLRGKSLQAVLGWVLGSDNKLLSQVLIASASTASHCLSNYQRHFVVNTEMKKK